MRSNSPLIHALPAPIILAPIILATALLATTTDRVVAMDAAPQFNKPASASPVQKVRHKVLAADASKRRIAIFDERGEIVWETETRSIHDLQYLENGNVLFQTTWTRLVEMTPEKEIAWSYDSAKNNGNAGKRVEVHAFRRLAGGITMIAESGVSRIIEVDPDGNLLRSVPLTVRKSSPHRDTRLVRKLQNGNYLVAHEGDGVVREYDGKGKVCWEYAVPLFDKPRRGGHGLDAWGNQVFAAIRLPNGNTLISTGNGHSVLEVTPDKKIVWHLRQDDLPGIRLAWVTTLELLPTGNLLIGNCHAGEDNPQIVEITWDKKVVWTFKNFDDLGNSLSNSTLIDTKQDVAFYHHKVEPILRTNCYKCHGTRNEKIRGQLWLRARRNVLRGGASGAIVDLVTPEKSRVLRFINHEDSDHQMPPKKKLSAGDIAVLTEWVERRVPMPVVEDEWLYEKPPLINDEVRKHWAFQPVARSVPPTPKDVEWCRNPIDRFVASRREVAGLPPNPEADRVSLIRRLTYGVIGLPPTRAEIESFVQDSDPDAYDRLVDRVLASKHYGEHWARHWLDLVRYAETNGYERDSRKPEAWKYRQYVIDSFNSNKPYDRFVKEQIAGDELPDRDAASITGTGYLRLGLWDDEPADRAQALYDNLDDIVRTTSEVFLGLTVGCARCHDHKLDPIPQADYYSMLAFFRNVRQYSRNRNHILTDISTPAQKEEIRRKNARIAERRRALTRRRDAIRARFVELYEKENENENQVQSSGLSQVTFDYYRDSWTKLPDFDMLKPETSGTIPSNLFDIGLATRGDSFGFVFRGKLSAPRDGEYTFFFDSDDGACLKIDGEELVRYDGIHGLGQRKQAKVTLREGLHDIRVDYFQGHGGRGLEIAWRGPGMRRQALSTTGDKTQQLNRLLRREGKRILGEEQFAELNRLDREIRATRDVPSGEFVLSITERGPDAPDTHVMVRGNAHSPGEKVEPGFPQILTEKPARVEKRKSSSGRRLAFAEWLVDDDHLLTARVMVNRVWQFHFGRGLVRTSSDFGTTGDKPTHPQLLDWLAREFIDSGWDIKKLHKTILSSSTYRMSSAANGVSFAEDPRNDLLWRFDMRRLTAEELRDSILALSGELDLDAFGGPSVFPKIPPAVLKGQSANKWQVNSPPAHDQRRSVYTFVMRSLVDPFVETFDAATTDTSCAVRFQTTQPTQALTMLNSGFLNRAAARLAARLEKEVGANPRDQIRRAMEIATGRTPDDEQIDLGVRFLKTYPDAVDKDQPLQQFCLIVLNLNEFVFVD